MYLKDISQNNAAFLEKIAKEANLKDVYAARDLAEIVYRVMRDLMPKETIERVESELDKEAISTDDLTLQVDIAELWKDTNPIVSWLSRIRPPFKQEGPLGIDDNLFVTRIEREGAVPATSSGEQVITAVFKATKAELAKERISEIAEFLPGRIKQMWEQA